MKTDLANRIRDANREVHRREAVIYDAIHPEVFGRFLQKKIDDDIAIIASLMPAGTQIRVLDIGCGTGNLTLKYLKRGYQVKAVDLSPEMIGILKAKITPDDSARVQFEVCDAETIVTKSDTPAEWDIISFGAVLHHLPDYKTTLRNALKQLRPGGVLYVCHEPLRSEPPRSFARRAIAKTLTLLDTAYIYGLKCFIYMRQSIRDRSWFGRIDYSWSDYHLRTGIDAASLLRELEDAKATIIRYEALPSFFLNSLTTISNAVGLCPPSQFSFIAKRDDKDV